MEADGSNVHFLVSRFETLVTYDGYREYAIKRPFLPVIGISLYLLFLMSGRKVMQGLKPLDLKPLLFVWNTGLALFSIASTIRFASILIHQFQHNDIHGFFCSTETDNVSGFWYTLFVYSKFIEFGDTFFLVVRKRRIMFLHWYHHVTVLLMAWIVFVQKSAVGPFFGGVNVFVHSLMYTYYAAQTIGIKLPKLVSMVLTLLQTMQMLVGLIVVYQTDSYSRSKLGCNTNLTVTICASIMYASYFLLFARFFVQSYISTSPVSKKRKEKTLDVNHNHSKSQ